MKQLLLLLTTLFLLCISCNKESIDIETEDESGLVEVSVFYTTKENPNILMPDSYSKLYIYYDQHFTGFTGYSFQDGKLTKEGKTIFPDQSASADKEGKILLRLNYINKPLTLLSVYLLYPLPSPFRRKMKPRNDSVYSINILFYKQILFQEGTSKR